jgi:peptidoglycan/LPS O-acetylase OafA/YrhL
MTAIDTKPFAPGARLQAGVRPVAAAAQAENVLAIGYLRAFVTLLVVAHHAVLAYHPHLPPAAASLLDPLALWQAFPIVDAQRWPGIDLFTGWNDSFFMALMFLLSGLFVWASLERKGTHGFLHDRATRLGLPFAVAALLLAPLAYYPAYLATGAAPSLAGYARQWLALGHWPAGPAWFLWLLLAFDAVAALLHATLPRWPAAFERLLARPMAFFVTLVGLSAVAYLPLSLLAGPSRWTIWGPFAFQTSRLFHYLVYFLAGVALGRFGASQGLLAPGGSLARRWWLWVGAAVISFGVSLVLFIASLLQPGPSLVWGALTGFGFVLVSAATSLACLAVFVRFGQRRIRLFDRLRANAYGIFLLHYAAVTWLQLALLNTLLPAPAKGLIVIAGAVVLAWGAAAGLRRIPAVARVI